MIRLLSILVSVLVICVPAAEAAKKPTCRSGGTIYKRDGVREFKDTRWDGDYWYACGPRSRRPTYLYSAAGSYSGLSVTGRSGDRVLFDAAFSGEGGGEDSRLGWFDRRTLEARSGDLAGAVSNDVRDVVVAADGAIGVVAATAIAAGGRIAFARRNGRKSRISVFALAGAGALQRERLIAKPKDGVKPGSLAFSADGTRVTWRNRTGRRTQRAPVTQQAEISA